MFEIILMGDEKTKIYLCLITGYGHFDIYAFIHYLYIYTYMHPGNY